MNKSILITFLLIVSCVSQSQMLKITNLRTNKHIYCDTFTISINSDKLVCQQASTRYDKMIEGEGPFLIERMK